MALVRQPTTVSTLLCWLASLFTAGALCRKPTHGGCFFGTHYLDYPKPLLRDILRGHAKPRHRRSGTWRHWVYVEGVLRQADRIAIGQIDGEWHVGVYRKRYESRWSRSYKVLVRPIEVSEKVARALQAASTEVSF